MHLRVLDEEANVQVQLRNISNEDLLLYEYTQGELTPVEYFHFLLCKELYPRIESTCN